MDNIVETVRFKLKEGTDVNAFLAAAEGSFIISAVAKGLFIAP
ncbi:hypothetical protein [Enterovibrio coralii]|nr:hypothetical protein [Enterovibrio coralii]